jgi:hypothetical protein
MTPRQRFLDGTEGPAVPAPDAPGNQASRPFSRRALLARLAISSAAASAATLALLGAVAPTETAVAAPTRVVVDHNQGSGP